MKKTYTIAGVGVCLGKNPGFETLAESIITGSPIAGELLPDSLSLAVQEATQYTARKDLAYLTDAQATQLGDQKVCTDFREMLELAPENALLLSKRENGWLAIALTQEDTGFARVEITEGERDHGCDDFLNFLLCALEIRYALHLDERDTLYRFWDAQGQRTKDLSCGGLGCRFTEPRLPVSRIYEAKKYLLPIVFTTVEEAKQKLTALKRDSAMGLKASMERLLPALGERNPETNTIVLLAESREAMEKDIDDLLSKADRLLEEGFVWRSRSGSKYIRRSCADPRIVFMNPPASMFNPKTFYKFFFLVYGTMSQISRFETDRLLTGDKDLFLSDYLFDIVVNYCVTTLLESLGIRPDILSGASMGEMAILLNHLRNADGTACDVGEVLSYIEEDLRFMARSDDAPLNAHLGRETDGFTKYYVKGDGKKICAAAEKYDSVYVMIIGSTEDVILTGERAALRRLIAETGCIANELNVANYIHTPVVAHLEEKIRHGMLSSGVRLAKTDYTLFSTHFRKPMDESPEMLAENTAALLTRTVDYASAVEELYARDGRVFIDLSTTQMCGTWAGATLKEKKDAQVASLYSGSEASETLLNLCAALLASNVRFDASALLSRLSFRKDASEAIPVKEEEVPMVKTIVPAPQPVKAAISGEEFAQVLQRQILNNEKAFRMFMDAQNKLYEQMLGAPAPAVPAAVAAPAKFPHASKEYLFDRQQILTMTETSMAAVLGEKYREVDQYPVRARIPLPPFMFASRIISIDAEFGVFRPSSIVSEYDLDEDCVFRVGDTYICPLVASEASHIAIFLIAYMGLDAISKGTLAYRAIDSHMTAHSERPFRVGDTLRTVLKINRFVKNGSTTLLFFTFESYNGDELISVTEATGGFFTRADLESNKGIIRPKIQMRKNVEPKEFLHFTDTTKTAYEKPELDAFFRGDYKTCFGVAPKPTHKELYHLPHDMQMIDRVTEIDYNGGLYSRGIICGEKQITPDMWPFKAHFKNDPVFPAIITSDGVTQLGMFLFAHAGILDQFDNAYFTMIKGNCCDSKFRGQVRHGYSKLRYEVNVREVVQTEDHIRVYFDAAIFNDEIQIMQIDSYTLKISNADN